MGRYVLIESRDPYESRDVPYFYNLAADLAANGEQVTLFLVQNGALASRKDAQGDPLGGVLKNKVEVLADSFALRERGIQDSERHPSVKPAEIGSLVDHILAEGGTKVLWH
jgi:sulfur relay (sulfurtransferase) complex TusBCD TusD component (DsrE family)